MLETTVDIVECTIEKTKDWTYEKVQRSKSPVYESKPTFIYISQGSSTEFYAMMVAIHIGKGPVKPQIRLDRMREESSYKSHPSSMITDR